MSQTMAIKTSSNQATR